MADGGGQDGLSGMQAREQPRPGSAGGDLAEVAAMAGEVVGRTSVTGTSRPMTRSPRSSAASTIAATRYS
ncbi:MAG: hypothetical protein ACLQDY_01270 [Streptosporangiaceae bacterium]